MFNPSQEDVRRFFCAVHAKSRAGQPMDACQNCHGKVQEMDIVSVQQPFNMQWCLDCHRKPEIQASTDCITCHR